MCKILLRIKLVGQDQSLKDKRLTLPREIKSIIIFKYLNHSRKDNLLASLKHLPGVVLISTIECSTSEVIRTFTYNKKTHPCTYRN